MRALVNQVSIAAKMQSVLLWKMAAMSCNNSDSTLIQEKKGRTIFVDNQGDFRMSVHSWPNHILVVIIIV